MNTGILMLAAGASRRFGSDKRRALLASGTPLLQQALDNACASGLAVTLCLGPGDDDLARGPFTTVRCADAARGMGHTLAQGVAQLPPWDGVLIALGDMPHVQPATFCQVAASLAPGGLCQPLFDGQPGHPVGFSRHYFPALQALRGDTGARALLTRFRHALVQVPVTDAGVRRDIDTPADLEADRITP